jgi:hypothetical protein
MRLIAVAFLLLAGCACAAARKCPCPLPDKDCEAAVDAPAPDLAKAHAKPLSGVFVDLGEGVRNWDTALDRLACAGIESVIIQSVTFEPEQAQAVLRAAAKRAAAKQKAVRIYVGLQYRDDFSASSSSLEEALALDQAVADEVAGWPDELQAIIAGWYIANEIHNFQIWKDEDTSDDERLRLTWERAAELQRYLRDVTTYVRKKPLVKGKEVLISPHFNPTKDGALLSPARTRELSAGSSKTAASRSRCCKTVSARATDPSEQGAADGRQPLSKRRLTHTSGP